MPVQDSFAPLTRREHRYLWLLSQGFTMAEAAKFLGLSGGGLRKLGHTVRAKISARTSAHAVAVALSSALIGPEEECGTLDGYAAHRRVPQDPCAACRRAHTERAERKYAYGLAHRTIRFSAQEARLLQEFAAGMTRADVAARWGSCRDTVDRVARSLYLKLDVAHYPPPRRRREALREARRYGLVPPMPQAPEGSGTVYVRADRPPVPTTLTTLEKEILLTACTGLSLAEMSRVTGRSRSCLASHLSRIYRKLGVVDAPVHRRRSAARDELLRREALA